MDLVPCRMVGLLSWGRCCEERLTNPCRHITRVPKLEALSRHCHEDFDPNFCRSSALSLGLVPFPWLFVVSIYKLGGSGIPGDSLERMRWQPGYKGRICSFSSPEATVAPLSSSFWEWGWVQVPGAHIREITARAGGLPCTHQCAGPRQQNTGG